MLNDIIVNKTVSVTESEVLQNKHILDLSHMADTASEWFDQLRERLKHPKSIDWV